MIPVPILQVDSLGKTFDSAGNGNLLAIANISFTVSTGEFLCIVGPSGSGKTTLLQLLAGLLPPSKGQIRLDGTRLTEPQPVASSCPS